VYLSNVLSRTRKEQPVSEVLREQPSDGVVLLQLNRPERMNALSLRSRALPGLPIHTNG
jgi:hypothetical protein